MPKRRGSTKRRTVPSSKAKVRCSCGAARLRRRTRSRPGHAQMQQQDGAVVEEALDELGPPGEAACTVRPRSRAARPRRQGEADVGAPLDEAGHAAARSAAPPARAWSSRPPAAPAWLPPRPAARLPGRCRRPRTPHPRATMSAAICMSEDRTASPSAPAADPRRGGRRSAGALLRLRRGRARREGGAGPRRVPPGGLALRPDERPDERRRPPAVEGGAARLAGAAPRHAPARRRGRHRRHRHALPAAASTARAGSTLVDINDAMLARRPRPGAGRGLARRDRLAGRRRHGAAVPRPQLRRRHHRLRHPQRHPDRPRRWREARRVLRPGGRFLCLEFSRVVLPALGRLYDAYSFNVVPLLGRYVAERRGQLPLPGREHPPLPRPGGVRGADARTPASSRSAAATSRGGDRARSTPAGGCERACGRSPR